MSTGSCRTIPVHALLDLPGCMRRTKPTVFFEKIVTFSEGAWSQTMGKVGPRLQTIKLSSSQQSCQSLLLFVVIVMRYRVVSLVKLDSVVNVSVCRKSVECNLDGLSGISLSEVEEGSEPDDFWKAIGGKKYYCSLAHGKCFQDCSFNALTFRSNNNIEVLRA